MDLMEIFRQVGLFFFRICAVEFDFGPYRVSVASVLIFAGLLVIVISFVRRLGD